MGLTHAVHAMFRWTIFFLPMEVHDLDWDASGYPLVDVRVASLPLHAVIQLVHVLALFVCVLALARLGGEPAEEDGPVHDRVTAEHDEAPGTVRGHDDDLLDVGGAAGAGDLDLESPEPGSDARAV